MTVTVRGMSKTESSNTLMMWQMATIALFHSFLLLFGCEMPTPADAGMLFVGGLTNAAGQYFWTQALRLAPATAVSPFYYLMLVWAMVIGFLVWGEVPSTGLLIGSAIVVASGTVSAMARGKAASDNRGGAAGCGRQVAIIAAARRYAALIFPAIFAVLAAPSGDHVAMTSGTFSIGTARLR